MQNSFRVPLFAVFASGLLLLPASQLTAARVEWQQESAPAGQEITAPANLTAANSIDAEKEYAAGRAAMRRRDWKAAIQAFKRTVELDPEYRDARQRLAEARTILNNEEIEAVAARHYEAGVAAMARNDYEGALDAFEKVSRINRRYRDLEELYARLDGKLPQPGAVAPPVTTANFNAPPEDTAKTFAVAPVDSAPAKTDSLRPLEMAVANNAKLDSLVHQALTAFERDDWKSTVITLERLKFVQPNYRDLDDLAAVARTNFLRQAQGAEALAGNDNPKFSPLVIALAVLTVSGWLGLGLLAFSSAGRARFYRWRGNDVTAALLYEQMLAQKPERVELYPLLAEIYLRQQRRDATALQTFQKVLELNLQTPHRAELQAIMAEQERHKNQMPPAPRKPRKRRELATVLESADVLTESWNNVNGKFKHEDFERRVEE